MKFLAYLGEKIKEEGRISKTEALRLIGLEDRQDLLHLVALAHEITQWGQGNKIDLCSLINAKSGSCAEDCAFCAQSVHYNTNINTYPLLEPEVILQAAHRAEQEKVDHFCIVTSGKRVTDKEFEQILGILHEIKKTTKLEVDCSLGLLPKDHLLELKKIGISRYNHNLETSKDFFPKICTTHTYQDRLNTVMDILEVGLEACCGGIIGMGETWEDRLELAFSLRDLNISCVTINILNPRPGTPLAHRSPIPPWEIIKTIAIFRLILPRSIIKLAGGRERNLRDMQVLGLLAGANGIIVGGYLTTLGRPLEQDLQMISDLGLTIDRKSWKREERHGG